MEKLKPVDRGILSELMKNSHRSDRKLSKILKVSQPTVTRRRKVLEREIIEKYTLIPKLEKVGFELVAFTFVKSAFKEATMEQKKAAKQKGKEWVTKKKCVVFAMSGQGLGWDGLAVSFHRSYADYVSFLNQMRTETSDLMVDCQSFLGVIGPEAIIKPLDLTCLAQAE
jgi:DNA-binding Lrp family transcriptional regulator